MMIGVNVILNASFMAPYPRLLINVFVSIKFHSQSNNHGTVMFKIILEATAPEFCPSNAVDDACPDGPCCEGPDCCVIHAGTIPKGEVERITFIIQKIELFQRSAPLTTLYNLMLDNLAPTN